MIWQGKKLATHGDIGDAVIKIKTREEAAEFLALYEAETPHARVNIGYLAGYYSPETTARIYRLFGVSHPIFGTITPTPGAALEAGKRLAEKK